MSIVGQPLDRTDGILKVTGGAQYAAEFPQPLLAHGVLVLSTIASGRIESIDSSRAEQMPGVQIVLTYRNAMHLPNAGRNAVSPPAGRALSLLQDNAVHYQNQPIAVVVADTLERATDAARYVSVVYQRTPATLDFERAKAGAHMPKMAPNRPADTSRGDLTAGLRQGPNRIDAVYRTPYEHHNPMEPHATLAAWDGDRLTLYDATQYVSGVRDITARTFGIPPEHVHVICPFVGGGFGCKGSAWSHVMLAAMAAKQVGRPVRIALQRPQMFGPVGARPYTEQHIVLAARNDGTLSACSHDVLAPTSMIEDWMEPCAIVTRMLYAVPHQRTSHRVVPMNIGTPTFTRAPGEMTGSFAQESAMDELAVLLRMDPLRLRIKNHADHDAQENKPWSSKHLLDCYRVGAERFGWSRRDPRPRSMREGSTLIGWGMGTATYPANRSAASAVVRLLPDGTASVASGTQDLGTGTYTVMTQIAADALGLPAEHVRFALGDSSLPRAPVSGGSQSAASVAPAVRAACEQVRGQLLQLMTGDVNSPLAGAAHDDLSVENGWVISRSNPQRRELIATALGRHDAASLEATATVQPGDERRQYAFHSFGAVFVEARVDEALGTIRIPRVVAVYDVGRLLNAKTGRSQLMGGIVWGIGSALLEKSEFDARFGRFTNGNLADYHVPVNADIGTIDVTVLDHPDPFINGDGARGIGEIGITGVAGAIGNAVFHATGVRVRDLPITPDKVMMA
jgi:xanthine dehydrogenase YagR molybdenum-binding subunit